VVNQELPVSVPTKEEERDKAEQQSTARSSLADDAYRQLRDLIVSLKLSPGTTLSDSDLTVRLKVSRTPIRQALHRLQQEGFAVVSQSGAVSRLLVAPMTVDDMRELHAILGVLEGLAVRSAAALEPQPRRALVTRMRQLNGNLRKAWTPNALRVREAQDLHVQFHRSFVEAAAPPRLLAELNALQPQVERYERVYSASLSDGFTQSLAEHDALIEAIADGDADRAERCVITNWRKGSDRYARIAASLGERGNW
jgi:DNA-binding GntR family transcriptional regulator